MNAALNPTLPEVQPDSSAAAVASGPYQDRVRFRCLLDAQPGYLVPQSSVATTLPGGSKPSTPRELLVNPYCRFSWLVPRPDAIPSEAATAASFLDLSDDANSATSIVWVPNRQMSCWHPFWVGARYRETLASFRPGMPVPHDLLTDFSPKTLAVLRQSGILISRSRERSASQRWDRVISKAALAFRSRRYVNLPGLLHSFHVDAARRYYRRLIRTGGMYLGDGQTSRRYVAHNETLSRFFHHQLTHAVSALVGEEVMPSYTYVVSYLGGAELERHNDRAQCEFTLSLLLDYPPEHETSSPWPLCLDLDGNRDIPGRTVEITQHVGDALLFCGRALPHFRPCLPDGYTSTSVLFHYVRKDFTGTLD